MSLNRPSPATRITVTLTFIAMVTVNALANILPINGRQTGAISDAYPNLFAPTGLTFAIWGVIYLLLAAFTLFQLGLFQGRSVSANSDVTAALLTRIGLLFSVSSLANFAWIFSWHYNRIPLSMLLMLVILACLILISLALRPLRLTAREAFFVRLPFSVYFGWITVATIANATTLLVYWQWNGFGISAMVWTVAVLIVGALIGGVTLVRNRDIAYGLVLVWAYLGIWLKHTAATGTGFAGKYPAVMVTALACIGAFVIAAGYTIATRRNRNRRKIAW